MASSSLRPPLSPFLFLLPLRFLEGPGVKVTLWDGFAICNRAMLEDGRHLKALLTNSLCLYTI